MSENLTNLNAVLNQTRPAGKDHRPDTRESHSCNQHQKYRYPGSMANRLYFVIFHLGEAFGIFDLFERTSLAACDSKGSALDR